MRLGRDSSAYSLPTMSHDMQLSALVRGSAAHNVVVVLDLALRPQDAWEMIECFERFA